MFVFNFVCGFVASFLAFIRVVCLCFGVVVVVCSFGVVCCYVVAGFVFCYICFVAREEIVFCCLF